jgi:hypothetical protein
MEYRWKYNIMVGIIFKNLRQNVYIKVSEMIENYLLQMQYK